MTNNIQLGHPLTDKEIELSGLLQNGNSEAQNVEYRQQVVDDQANNQIFTN